MSEPGDVIEHVSLGMRCTWLETAASSDGRICSGRMFLPAGCPTPPPHVHPRQEERLGVVAGAAVVSLGAEERVLGAGQDIVIGVGTPHTFRPLDGDLTIIASLSPALDWDEFCRLAWQVPSNPKGRPDFFRMASVLHRYPGLLYMAGPPIVLQRALIAAAARVAQLTGRSVNPPT